MNIVSFGGGTNSAALLIGLYKHKIPIDLITFADTGAEHPHTYQFIEIINAPFSASASNKEICSSWVIATNFLLYLISSRK